MSNEDRIEKDAILKFSDNGPLVRGYIAGATAEHERMAEILKSFNQSLQELEMKEIEYKECATPENINFEYFKGKRDAYKFAVKTMKRALQWHAIKSE